MGDSRFLLLDTKIHDRSAFVCGEPSLEQYLKEQARKEQEGGVSTVVVLADGQRIIGYFTLCATTISLEDLADQTRKRLPRYPHVPAILLGRLAVDVKYQGQSFGEKLLLEALKTAQHSAKAVAAWAVVVDALHQKAAQFYASYGFLEIPQKPLRLFLPMKTIRDLVE
jgi:predicted GNAT family N-acyltransferase